MLYKIIETSNAKVIHAFVRLLSAVVSSSAFIASIKNAGKRQPKMNTAISRIISIIQSPHYESISLVTSTQAVAWLNSNSSPGVNSIALLDEPHAGNTVLKRFTLSSI